MTYLNQVIPDVEQLLAMAPEELARVLLSLIPDPNQVKRFLPDYVGRPPTNQQPWYPQHRLEEVDIALDEAWAWLSVNLLIIPDSGTNGANGYRVLTRRGRQIHSEATAFEAFIAAAAFPRELIHPKIRDKVWLRLSQGELDDAVFAAFKEVEIAVRHAGEFPQTEVGVKLMRKAFDANNGRLTAFKTEDAGERQALSDLFAGAIGSYKNPFSHRTVSLQDPTEAQEMVMLASHLLRIVESRGQHS